MFLYLIATGSGLFYAGDGPAYASAPGQIDPAKARFLTGHFTRADGVEQIAMVYQHPNHQIKVQIFDPAPQANPPVGGFAEMWTSPTGTFDVTRAKFAAADVDGDKHDRHPRAVRERRRQGAPAADAGQRALRGA